MIVTVSSARRGGRGRHPRGSAGRGGVAVDDRLGVVSLAGRPGEAAGRGGRRGVAGGAAGLGGRGNDRHYVLSRGRGGAAGG